MVESDVDESVVSAQLANSREELASSVRKILEREAQRNEARVAMVRMVAYSLVLVLDILMYAAGYRALGNVLVPSLVVALAIAIWWALQKHYWAWFGYVIPIVDAIFIVETITSRIARLGGASTSLIATAALSCGLFAATGAIRFDRRIAAWTTFLSLVVLWLLVGVRADAGGMLYAVAALLALAMLNVTLTDMARRSIEASAGKMLLGRFVQQQVVDRAFSNPSALLAKPKQVEATVLVSDLRGFTALSETLKPAKVLALLSEVQSAFAAIVKRHGGTVDKFMGDGMLAVFGAPDRLEGHASHALAAAADIRRAVAELNAQNPQRAPLRVGIGLHSGMLIAGVLGSGERMEFTVLGDTVNTASRIESMTKEHGVDVLVTGATVALAPGAQLQRLGDATVRGRSGVVELYTLPVERAASARPGTQD